jgi:hypothetical protein
LAAYYQVSVVLLEPEEPKTKPGRVLAYGVQAFVAGMPRLESSWNTLVVTLPSESQPREIELRPAQTPPTDKAPNDAPEASWLNLDGHGLLGLKSVLLLRNARWESPLSVDDSWQVVVGSESVRALVRESIATVPLFPGIYGASVRVTRRTTMSDGRVVDTEHLSNETPFAVTPRIDTVSDPADPDDEVAATGYGFTDPSAAWDKEVQVYVGPVRLTPKKPPQDPDAPPDLAAGEFRVVEETSGPELQLKPLDRFVAGQSYLLRIFVNGAESPPAWIKKP